ncbi:unnamed protein product [Caenorhabditis nigoni]
MEYPHQDRAKKRQYAQRRMVFGLDSSFNNRFELLDFQLLEDEKKKNENAHNWQKLKEKGYASGLITISSRNNLQNF